MASGSTSTRCATRRPGRWPEQSSCVARCTAGRKSATSCRSPKSRCWRRSSRCPSTSRCTRPRAASPPCSPAPSPARPCCCAATWTPCRSTRTPGWSSRRATTTRCTPAVTTPTRRCSSAPPVCSPNAPATWPAVCCSCSSRARKVSTAPGSCSTRGCSTCRRSLTGRRRRSPGPSPCTSPRCSRPGG